MDNPSQETATTEAAVKTKRQQVSLKDKEQALRDKIAAMQVKLEQLEQGKIEKQAKKLDKAWARLRVHLVTLGLTDVPVMALEQLITDNADKLRLTKYG